MKVISVVQLIKYLKIYKLIWDIIVLFDFV